MSDLASRGDGHARKRTALFIFDVPAETSGAGLRCGDGADSEDGYQRHCDDTSIHVQPPESGPRTVRMSGQL